MKSFIAATILSTVIIAAQTFETGYRGIIPLKSTRAEASCDREPQTRSQDFNKKRGDSDVPTHFYYVDKEQGLVIDLNGDGAKDIVSALIYQPAAKYKHLRCPEEVIPSSE